MAIYGYNTEMKLTYLTNARVPTEKAYGIQLVKMCDAFSRCFSSVELFVAYRWQSRIMRAIKKQGIYQYYGVPDSFVIKWLAAIDFNTLWVYTYCRLFSYPFFYLQVFTFCLSAVFVFLFKKTDIIYSRDEFVLYLLSFFKKNLFWEAHIFPEKGIFFYKRLFKKLNGVIVINNILKDLFVKAGLPEQKILVAPDAVDAAEFQIKESQEQARIKLGLPLDKKLVVYTGHLFVWKGTDVLARASCYLPDDVEIILVGGSPETLPDFTKFIEKDGLFKVKLLGHQPHNLMPYYLRAADVLVLPNSGQEKISRYYTSPLKLFEYMAAQKPIVASDLPSIREVVRHNENIWLVEPDNPAALADGLKEVLQDKKLAEQLSQKAFIAAQCFTWAKRAVDIAEFIKQKQC